MSIILVILSALSILMACILPFMGAAASKRRAQDILKVREGVEAVRGRLNSLTAEIQEKKRRDNAVVLPSSTTAFVGKRASLSAMQVLHGGDGSYYVLVSRRNLALSNRGEASVQRIKLINDRFWGGYLSETSVGDDSAPSWARSVAAQKMLLN
jgi:hypothetical protein